MKNVSSVALIGSVAMMIGCSGAKAPAPVAHVLSQPAAMDIVRIDPALDAVIAPGTKIEKVATGFKLTEGTMWHDGRLWFSDLMGNKMYAVSPDGKVELLIDHSGGLQNVPDNSYEGSNAMVTDKDGTVLMCQHGLRRIVRLDSTLKITPFLDKYKGKKLNSPNDLVFAPDGSLWFTDPPYGLTGQDEDPAKELPFNGVYRYARGTLTLAIKDLTRPNGVGFSPDGKTLYVSNSGPKMFLSKYDVAKDGTVSNGTQMISYPDLPNAEVPDGLKVDSAGNIWTTGPGGIRILTPKGNVLGQIKLPEVASNLAWADDGKTLYIAATTGIYRMKVATPGTMPLYSK